MATLGRKSFLAIAIFFHLLYMYSIFDIYFVSPIVSGMRAYGADLADPPAKRLVLIVGDGLRADKAFQEFPDPSPNAPNTTETQRPRRLMPFIRSRIESHGTFGVSHTRVPTESRPGHVALIGGLYEDVSAVATGWKLNPVHFDSVFNRSRRTWSWGSPDILPMFKEGAVPGRVHADTYGAEAEDFTSDATHLDTWVFDKVKTMFKEAERDQKLNEELRKDKNVLFLHLLGLDTTGHGFRPYSREYLHNIQVVDRGVKEVTELIESFYGDGQTAFVFTADHGMSDWGSHGDGHPDNTRTPLVAWGSGVAKPKKVKKGIAPGHDDGFSSDWDLDRVQRHDVEQADIAALMAYLAGLDYPVNSVGQLPLSYLSADPKSKAKALLANAQEVLEMYHVKEEHKRSAKLRFKPYAELSGDDLSAAVRVDHITKLIAAGSYDDAIEKCLELMKVSLGGLQYLQTYDWLFLRVLVTIGYLGWIAFALTTAVDLHVLQHDVPSSRTTASLGGFGAVLAAIYSFLLVERSPWTYYAYVIFPVAFWEEVYARRDALAEGGRLLLREYQSSEAWFGLLLKGVAYLGVLEALAQSYFYRDVYTVCYLLATTWPVFYGLDFLKRNLVLVTAWVASCVTMSTFTMLPAMKTENLNLVLLGGLLMLIFGLAYLAFENKIIGDAYITSSRQSDEPRDTGSRVLVGFQTGLIALAMIVTYSSVKSLQARQGLPLGTQVVGWITLLYSLSASPIDSFLRPKSQIHYLYRLTTIFLTFAPMFVILTIEYEGLFYIAFCTTLFTWLQMERRIYEHTVASSPDAAGTSSTATSDEIQKPKPTSAANGTASPPLSTQQHDQTGRKYRSLALSDLRTPLFFLYLIHSAFFSVGNIPSISSFSLDAVYRLLPIFDPFSQGTLLIVKILSPFVVISAVLGVLTRMLHLKDGGVFLVVVAVVDWLTVRFFWSVSVEGSWLEIGESISRFGIVSLVGVFCAAIEGGGGGLVGGVVVGNGAGEGGKSGGGGGAGSGKENNEAPSAMASNAKLEGYQAYQRSKDGKDGNKSKKDSPAAVVAVDDRGGLVKS